MPSLQLVETSLPPRRKEEVGAKGIAANGTRTLRTGLLASLLGAFLLLVTRMLLGAPDLTTRSKRTLLGAKDANLLYVQRVPLRYLAILWHSFSIVQG